MAKKARKNKATPSLADDIRASLQELLKYARGEKADVIVHRVVPCAIPTRAKPGTSSASRSSKANRKPSAARLPREIRRRDANLDRHRRLPVKREIYCVAECRRRRNMDAFV